MNRNAIKKQIQEISRMSELPQHIRDIIVQNKKMSKKIIILQAQIQQKNRVIYQLKEHLDSSIIEQTQNKLSIIRTVDEQVEEKVKDIKQKYFEKTMEMQGEIDGLRQVVKELRNELGKTDSRSQFYVQKIDSLKQYMVDVIGEKDYLIGQLSHIISEQQKKINSCSYCNKSPSQLCKQQSQKMQRPKKIIPYIGKNE